MPQTFGDHAGPMALLGDKIGSTILAQSADVPTIPWSGSNVTWQHSGNGNTIPTHVYQQVCKFIAA